MVSSELDHVINIILPDATKRKFLIEIVGVQTIQNLIELGYNGRTWRTNWELHKTWPLPQLKKRSKNLCNDNQHILNDTCPLTFNDRNRIKVFILWWLSTFCTSCEQVRFSAYCEQEEPCCCVFDFDVETMNDLILEDLNKCDSRYYSKLHIDDAILFWSAEFANKSDQLDLTLMKETDKNWLMGYYVRMWWYNTF